MPKTVWQARGLTVRIFRNYRRWWWGLTKFSVGYGLDLGPISINVKLVR